MIRWNTFGRSALFAAVAAAGWIAWAVVTVPLFGSWTARTMALVGTTALYVAGLSRQGTRRVVAGVAAGLVGTGLAVLAHTTAELAIGLCAVLGVARSGMFYRATCARAATTEAALLIGGLLFARFLAGGSLLSTASALWGFLLVQSTFFLFVGVQVQMRTDRHPDAFDEAHKRAITLLEGSGV